MSKLVIVIDVEESVDRTLADPEEVAEGVMEDHHANEYRFTPVSAEWQE